LPQVSTHIEEIIGKKPSWLIRFGISGMLLMLLTLLFVSWLVKYPDVIQASISISTPNPPVDLLSPANAQIEEIFINKNVFDVKKGNPLILLKSTVSYAEVQSLKLFLNEISVDTILTAPDYSSLGLLQNSYNQLTSLIKDYNGNLTNKPYEKRINFLKKIGASSKQSLKSSNKRFSYEIKEEQMVVRHIQRTRNLFVKGVIAEQEYDIERKRFYQKEMQIENSRLGLINQKTTIIDIEKQLAELDRANSYFYTKNFQ
jgi:hypothetical protein